MRKLFRPAILLAALVIFTSSLAFGDQDNERTEWRHDIHLGASEQSSDLTCFGCSIYVEGKAAGDVTAFGGRVVVADQAEIAGDVTALIGDIRLEGAAKIAGDVTALGGSVHRSADAQVAGDVTSKEGSGWLLGLLIVPLFLLGVVIAFVVWLVQRSRRPAPAPGRA